MKFSLVIPIWNSLPLLKKNLPAVIAGGQAEIIVGDDGSTDGSLAFLKTRYPQIKVVSHPRLGFAGNVNAAVRAASGEIVVLLNTDVSPGKGFLKPLVKDFADPSVFGVSLNEINHPDYGPARGKFENGYITFASLPKSKKPVDTFWVSGGSGAFRRSMWDELGGFDETFGFYWEDLDLGYRAQKRGWRCLWEPDSMVVHEHEGTVRKLNQKKLSRLRERNQLLFIWKNLTDGYLFRRHLAGLASRFRRPGYLRVFAAAIVRFGTVWKFRNEEKSHRVVSDNDLLEIQS